MLYNQRLLAETV